MDWDDPLRHLAPISKQPAKKSTLSSKLSSISDEELTSLKVNVKLDRFGFACDTAHPQAAHIIPHAINSTNTRRIKLQYNLDASFWFLFGNNPMPPEIADDFVGGKPAVSDQPWNMVSLCSRLHTWWDKQYFGIEYTGHMPLQNDKVRIEARMQWLPIQSSVDRDNLHFIQKINLHKPDEFTDGLQRLPKTRGDRTSSEGRKERGRRRPHQFHIHSLHREF
ncbi:hypothetical protein B0T25DRAFT_62309 [Lasiosphaeria hispida]|uniref:HNH nuclease domain-containing protein n=1 Tax=Lasiosphaeria hispida TaxID=260671 RepID=A0AAJ0HXA4_9PEZI|nr:hypothetical protein B0T25DRAFT_62309 [Lasiosphaeria hispida]